MGSKRDFPRDASKIAAYRRKIEAKKKTSRLPKETRICSVATGGWGLGKCDLPGVNSCPRCHISMCKYHTSSRERYRNEWVCETCARGMSDDTA